ncbi:MAG TPA: carbamoyltransferase [Candidatus Sulfotelmatobacter sp.]|nr:carbamoyltransferase [Candidatus Sulfotelmatobacter sp.]
MNILGISAFYHDAAAVLVRDGDIVAAAQEERFTRIKHDASFPLNAIRYCLSQTAGKEDGKIDVVAFYDKPITKLSRILTTHLAVAPRGVKPFVGAMPVWMKQRLWIPLQIEKAMKSMSMALPTEVLFFQHHQSHAASAFFPSPFQSAAILTMDGVGEWATTTIGRGRGNRIEILQEIRFPHSLGLLYSAFTHLCGFKVNSGEYKLMGLAPYGEPRYEKLIYEHLLRYKEDGSFRLNLEYFGFLDSLYMTNDKLHRLFGGPPRKPESQITQREMDIACSIQRVTEDMVMRMARHAHEITGEERLCLAGGIALNCVANGRLLREGPFEDLWIQPAAGDAGGALGAALMAWYQVQGNDRAVDGAKDAMKGAHLGPSYSDETIGAFLRSHSYPARELQENEWAAELARLIDAGKIVGVFDGRLEYGPRALGSRSIVGDARSPDMQSRMNVKIKFRESFRPFAPACLNESRGDYFELDRASPYMLLTANVNRSRRIEVRCDSSMDLGERVHQLRSDLPAVTHIDYSARVQTVSQDVAPRFHSLIKAFQDLTGCAVIINTSFNVRGEPIVCTPDDAYRCFMRTGMDYLALGNFLLDKSQQPVWTEAITPKEIAALD